MAGQRGIRAGKAFVELTTNNSKLIKGLRNAQKRLKRFGRSISGMGTKLLVAATAITAPIVAATMKFASFGDAVNKMSARTGLSAKAVSSLGFAAEQSGADMATLEKGFQGLARFTLNAERGLTTATDSLDDLGLSLSDLAGKSPEGQFKVIADKLAAIEDPGRKAALAMSIFGKSGAKLVPLLSAGADGISALQAEAERLGITLSDEDAQAAADLTDAMNRMKRSLAAAWLNGGAALADGMTKIANIIAKVASQASAYIKKNQVFIMAIVTVGAAVGVAAGLFLSFGASMFLASAAIGGVVSIIGVVVAVLGAIASPVGIAVAALAALVTWLVRSGVAMEWLGSTFGPMFDRFKDALGAIASALARGDIGDAARVFWTTLNLWWTIGTNEISEIWEDMTTGLLKTFSSMTSGIATMMLQLSKFATSVWNSMMRSGESIALRTTVFFLKALGKDDLAKAVQKHGDAQLKRGDKKRDKALKAKQAALDENELITKEKLQKIITAREASGDKNAQRRREEESDAKQIYFDSLEKANKKKKPGGEDGSTLDDLLNKLSDFEAGGLPSFDGAGTSPSGTFSALSSLMFGGGSKLTAGDKAIVNAILTLGEDGGLT